MISDKTASRLQRANMAASEFKDATNVDDDVEDTGGTSGHRLAIYICLLSVVITGTLIFDSSGLLSYLAVGRLSIKLLPL